MSALLQSGCVLLFLLTLSCGYQLGGTRPEALLGVETLHIAMPENETQITGLEANLANHLVDGVLQEGSYLLTSKSQADAVLRAKIREVDYAKIRSSRTDALRPEELRMKLIIDWSVVQGGGSVLLSGSTEGSTRFFLDENLQTSTENAFPDALSRAALRIVQKLSDSY